MVLGLLFHTAGYLVRRWYQPTAESISLCWTGDQRSLLRGTRRHWRRVLRAHPAPAKEGPKRITA